MDLGPVDVDEKASSHSADDSHQHYATSEVVDDRRTLAVSRFCLVKSAGALER